MQLIVVHISKLVRFDKIRAPKIGNDGRQRTFYFYFPVTSNARKDKEFLVEGEKKSFYKIHDDCVKQR